MWAHYSTKANWNLNCIPEPMHKTFLDFINLYNDPDDQTSLSGQIAALEVDMVTLSHATHNPWLNPNDIGNQLQPLEATVSNSSSAASIGSEIIPHLQELTAPLSIHSCYQLNGT